MLECDNRFTFQVEPYSIDRVVTPFTGFQRNLPTVVYSSCRPVPDQHAWDIDNINWLCLVAYAYPSTALLHMSGPKDQTVQLPCHTNCPRLARDVLVLWPSASLKGDPTPVAGVQNTIQTASQSGVSQQPSISEPTRLASRSGQLQEWDFSVEVSERIAAPQRPSTRTIYKWKWALFEKWCRENSVNFSIYKASFWFLHVLFQDLNSTCFKT